MVVVDGHLKAFQVFTVVALKRITLKKKDNTTMADLLTATLGILEKI